MGFDTKPNFSSNKFEQCNTDIMNLSGCTQIYGTLDMESGSTLSICDNIGDGKVLTSSASGVATWQTPVTSSSASGENITKEVNQSTHGFAVKDFVGWSGGTYNKAIADGNYDGEFVGMITECVDANNFKVTQSGYVTGMTSLTANTTYFLSEGTAGLITDSEPTGNGEISKAVLIANSTTSGWVLPYVGYIISTGTTSISTADNGLTVSSGIVGLGGTLCQATTIDTLGNVFKICDTDNQNNQICLGIAGVGMRVGCTTENYGSLAATPTAVSVVSQSGSSVASISLAHATNKISFNSAGNIRACLVQSGFYYGGDYSGTGGSDPRWIPDIEWVTGNTSSGCGDYSSNSPSTCTVGGITAGTVLTGNTLECLLQEMLAPYIEPTFSAFAVAISSPMEVGDGLSGVKTFTWSTTTSGNVTDNCLGICQVGGSVLGVDLCNDGTEALAIGTLTNTTPTTWTWQISGCSTQGTPFTRNTSKCSIYPVYYGVETSGSRPTVNNALVNTGTKSVVNSTSTVTVDFNSSGQWTWVATPATSTTKTCWYVTALNNGGMGGGGDKYPDVCTLDITSGDGCWSTVSYKVYMSGFAATDADPIQFRNS